MFQVISVLPTLMFHKVATRSMCGEIVYHRFARNLPLSLYVKEFWKIG